MILLLCKNSLSNSLAMVDFYLSKNIVRLSWSLTSPTSQKCWGQILLFDCYNVDD